ncbi:hypothetical protein AKJ16_DCAP06177 [Drosera capensis]
MLLLQQNIGAFTILYANNSCACTPEFGPERSSLLGSRKQKFLHTQISEQSLETSVERLEVTLNKLT